MNIKLINKLAVDTYKQTGGAKFLLNYHFIWRPRRKNNFLQRSPVKKTLQKTIEELGQRHQFEIINLEIKPGYIHLFLSSPPSYSPSKIMNIIKGTTGKKLAQNFPQAKIKGAVWEPEYTVSSDQDIAPTIF